MELAYDIFSILSLPILIIGTAIGLIFYKKLIPPFKYIVFYIIISLAFDITHRFFNENNLFLEPLYGVFELLIFSTIYERYLLKQKNLLRLIVRVFILLLLGFDFIRSLIEMDPNKYITYGVVLMNLYIFYTGVLFLRKFLISDSLPIPKQIIILNAAVLVYFGFNVVFTASINFLVNVNIEFVIWFWFIFAILNIVFNLLNVYLLWQIGKTRKHSQFG